MSTSFWVLGLVAASGLTWAVCYGLIGERLCRELTSERKQLESEQDNFKRSYAEKQHWYAQAYHRIQEKETELQIKEKQCEALKKQLEAQIVKNNQEKEECFLHFRKRLTRLETQLDNARQRAKRFAKQAGKTV